MRIFRSSKRMVDHNRDFGPKLKITHLKECQMFENTNDLHAFSISKRMVDAQSEYQSIAQDHQNKESQMYEMT